MPKVASSALIAGLIGLVVSIAPAHAQLARTFVSSLGNDANDCNRLTPCRTFQRAHDNSLPLGEITVLDAGGYGSVTITKAISIINDGVGEAGVLVSGGANGITVNAGSNDAVNLRGLTVKGIGFGGGNGVVFMRAKSLTVEKCAIRGLDGSGKGIGLLYTTLQAGGGVHSLAVSDTVITDNQSLGLAIGQQGPGTLNATISRVELHNNGSGLAVDAAAVASLSGMANATISDTIATDGATGFEISAATNSTTNVVLVRSTAAYNGTGVSVAGTGATLRIGQSTITGNGIGWTGTVLQSYGDNRVNGNGGGEDPMPLIGTK